MKHIKVSVVAFFIFFLCLPSTWAQNTSTQGKDFWVSFMGNGFKTRYPTLGPSYTWLRIQLIVSAKRDCNCTVSNPNTSYQRSFHVNANSTHLFDNIPWEEAYMELDEYGRILNKGLHITADDTISVYCANIAEVSFDASYILPTPALGDDYIIQTYDQSSNEGSPDYRAYYTSAFLIVATEEGETSIDITPKVNTLDGHLAGETYTIVLSQGEAYQVRSHNNYSGSRDLSGTRVTAADCKKIAVFNGNNLTMVPTTGADSDCIFEQAMPLSAWGKKFVVTASLGRQLNDFVKITSAHNGNEILKNGNYLTTLREGESIVFELQQSEKSCFIEASSSCAVYLYNHSKDPDYYNDNGVGAPSMVWIAPIEQRINEITFSTFNYDSEYNTSIDNHYVNIIVNSDDIQNVYLDGEQLSPLLFEPVNGTSEYRFFRKEISHNSHHLTCANGFNAHVYGFGHAKGYAYMVGSNAKNLSSNLTINNETVMPGGVYTFCAEKEVTFNAEVNYVQYDILWDFGDGTTSTDNPAHHTYHDRRVYNASLYISTDVGGCTGSSSNTTDFIVDATQQYVKHNDEVCEGELYSGHGFNNVHITNDTILVRLQNNPIHNECQDSVLVYITAHPNYHIPIDDSRCWQGQPGVYDDYGFSFIYDHPGIYDRELNLMTHNYGCDSIITLHLTVANQITYEFSDHECSESYVWDGQTYDAPGDYERLYVSPGGCDSIVTLHLTMGRPDYNTFDTITCGVFHWHGNDHNATGTYVYNYTNESGCPSADTLHLTLSGNVDTDTIFIDTCDSFEWLGKEYTDSGKYDSTFMTSLGCDSTLHLKLNLSYTPNPTEIYPLDPENTAPHWVITATEFQINAYDFYFWETGRSRWTAPVNWRFVKKLNDDEWVDDPNTQWVLEPDSTTSPIGMRCKMYVLNYMPDTIWLAATAKSDCGETTRYYWFVCSFYDVEEHSEIKADFNVIPNPNSGEMMLNFEQMDGRVEVKVYDMRGTLIDHIQTENTANKHSISYNLNVRASGIYCFVATGRNGTVAKKVIVTH